MTTEQRFYILIFTKGIKKMFKGGFKEQTHAIRNTKMVLLIKV